MLSVNYDLSPVISELQCWYIFNSNNFSIIFYTAMSSQSTHNYYTRSSNEATNSVKSIPKDCNPTPVTLGPLSSLETKLLACFDEVQNGLLNVWNIIIKNLQKENERLQRRISCLDKKVISLESRHNMLEQYGRRNNLEITGIPDSVPQRDLENKVVDILNAIGVNVSNDDFEDCHRIGKSWNNSKKKQFLDSPIEKLLKMLCITERN